MDETPLQKGYLKENYRFFHLYDTEGQELDYHFHDFDKLVFLLSGRVGYFLEDREFLLAPGSVLLVKHHVLHRVRIDSSEPYERIIIYLRHEYFESLLPKADLMAGFSDSYSSESCYRLPEKNDREEIQKALLHCEAGLRDRRPGADVLMDSYMIQLLVAVNRLDSWNGAMPITGAYDEKIRSSLDYIHSHLNENLTVDFLCGRVFLSRYHFMRLFKQQTGESVHSYITMRRLLSAARMIREGSPSGLAASSCGFGDYSSFSRAIRRRFGIQPSELK